MKQLFGLFLLLFIVGCSSKTETKKPAKGMWRASLDLGNDVQLPFLMEFKSDSTLVVFNADEEIEIDDITYTKDSIFIKHPVFEGVIKGVYYHDSIIGSFVKPDLNRTVPIKIKAENEPRFFIKAAPHITMTGSWEATFSPNSEANKYPAKGIFQQKGNRLTGTFETTTGDYRYLDGIVENDSIKLSAFDFSHAFLFEGELKDSILQGTFYSGNHYKEPFTAKRNDHYELPSADSLTFLKKEYSRFQFSFPNTEGDTITLMNPQFQNKAVVVQIMGSWCPNCLDETRYFTEYYKSKPEDVAFVALAFEYAPTEEKAFQAIKKLKKALNIPYPILLAQYGSSNKQQANDKLPMLNHVLSYPTTIFIDKKGEVRKIHTGFNGPATGVKYEAFTKEFESFVDTLANENYEM